MVSLRTYEMCLKTLKSSWIPLCISAVARKAKERRRELPEEPAKWDNMKC